nr:hypothetical protein [Tanacetum cinerariifolium]
MERFENAIFKQREEINDKMTAMFGLLKELTASRTLKKVLIREKARHLITKHVNSISLIRGEGEQSVEDNVMSSDSIEKPDGSDAVVPLKEIKKENEAKNRLTDEIPAEMDTILSLAIHSYIYLLGIAEDVLVDVVGYVYIVDFVILDIKEEKRPFNLGTPLLTTTKIEKGTKNNIEPIAPTMIVNRLILEWEERIKLHQEKETKFDQLRSKIFNNECLTPVKEECEKAKCEIFTVSGYGVKNFPNGETPPDL